MYPYIIKDVNIRNNTFIECGSPVISILPENRAHRGAVHKNIRVEKNDFRLSTPKDIAIQAKSVDNLKITDNIFSSKNNSIIEEDQLIKVLYCTNVKISKNKKQ